MVEDVGFHTAHGTEFIKLKELTPSGQLALCSHFRHVHGIESSPSCSVLMNNSLAETTGITMKIFFFLQCQE